MKIKNIIYLISALLVVGTLAMAVYLDRTSDVAPEESDASTAIYYISTSGSDNNTGSSTSPWRTIDKANQTLVAGETVIIRDGTYTERIQPVNSGSSGMPITYKGENSNAVVRSANLSGKRYINIENLTFHSTSGYWIETSPATASTTSNINISDSTFYSTDLDGGATAHTFWGIRIYGDYYTIRNNKFLKWYGGDSVQLHGEYGIVENNDFSKNDSGHGSLIIYGSNIVARNNYFRNRWDRAMEISAVNGEMTTNRLIENNIIFDSNWNRVYDYPEGAMDGGVSNTGTTQMAKIGGSVTIYRNNLVVATNEGPRGENYDYKGVYEITPYGEAYYWRHIRFYNNTMSHNDFMHGIHMGVNATSYYMEDNVFKNNIIVPPAGKYSLHINRGESYIPLSEYTIESNILTQPVLRVSSTYTATSLNSSFNSTPDRIKNNISNAPTFRNPNSINTARSDSTSNTKIAFDDFTLANGSAGKTAATHLTEITQNSSGNTLKVDDAYYFFDGYGLIDGDEILVGTERTRVTDVVDKNTLTINPAISVQTGEYVYLAAYGASSDLGIIDLSSVPSSTPTPTAEATPTITPTPTATPATAVSNLTLTPANCLSGPTTSDALTISWTNPAGGPNANMIQIGLSSSYTPTSYRRTSGITGTNSVSVPSGFTEYSGSTNTGIPFTFQPDTTYYVRVYNGSYTPTQTVSIPTCPSSTPTPVPTTTPVVTPTPVTTVTATPSIPKAIITSVVTQGCISGGTFTVNWTNPNANDLVSAIDVSTDINFANNNFYHKTQLTGVTSYTGPSGFVHRNDDEVALVLQANTNYYVRAWNGVHSDQSGSTVFSIASCPTPTPGPTSVVVTPTPTPVGTNIPETVPTPTPTAVITPRSNNGGGGGGGGRTTTSNETCDSPFNDISCDNKFIDYISELKNSEVINGYSDGSYKPTSNVTRAEMATFIVNAFGLTTDNIETKMTYSYFNDSIEGTHKGSIVILKNLNVVSGYSDFTYRPNEYVKREEISKFIFNALKAKGVAVTETNSTFVDVSSRSDFYQYIGYLQYSDVIGGYSDGRYGPTEPLTREQMAKIITLSRELAN